MDRTLPSFAGLVFRPRFPPRSLETHHCPSSALLCVRPWEYRSFPRLLTIALHPKSLVFISPVKWNRIPSLRGARGLPGARDDGTKKFWSCCMVGILSPRGFRKSAIGNQIPKSLLVPLKPMVVSRHRVRRFLWWTSYTLVARAGFGGLYVQYLDMALSCIFHV